MFWFTLEQLDSIDDRSFDNNQEVGSFAEIIEDTEFSTNALESEYELLNTPLGCYLIERSDSKSSSGKMKAKIYPVKYKKLLEVYSTIEEENQINSALSLNKKR